MTNSRHELARAPGTHDGLLDVRIALDVNHRPEATRHQDGIIVRGVHFGQLAAVIQTTKGFAFKKLLLGGVFLVVRIVGRPSAGRRREFDRDSRLVEHVERMSDLSKKEAGLAIVRTNHGCISDDEQNVLGHGFLLKNDDGFRDSGPTNKLAKVSVAQPINRHCANRSHGDRLWRVSSCPPPSRDHHFITALPTTSPALIRSRYSFICSNLKRLVVWRILSWAASDNTSARSTLLPQ